MKNIHVLPTDKPSRLHVTEVQHGNYDHLNPEFNRYKVKFLLYPKHKGSGKRIFARNNHITSDEVIKEGDWVLGDYPDNPIGKVIAKYGQEFTAQSLNGDKYGLAEYDSKKIILTTDQDLIKEGVQAIDDEFLEWFVKNPSCERVDIEKGCVLYDFKYKIIIPKEEPKQETIEEAAERLSKDAYKKHSLKDDTFSLDEQIQRSGGFIVGFKEGLKEGANWQAEKMYNEEEVILYSDYVLMCSAEKTLKIPLQPKQWFEQAKEMEKQRMIDLVQQLKDYTRESYNVLGFDEREATEFVEIFTKETFK